MLDVQDTVCRRISSDDISLTQNRKKKCDSTKTPCPTCTRLNLQCERKINLVWEDDTRRVGMRRRGPPKAFQRAALETPPGKFNSEGSQTPQAQLDQPVSLGPPFSYWAFDLSATDSFLLNRYIQRFSRTYPAFSGPTNPFLSILLPLSTQSRVVLDCLLALSAVQSWENENFAMEKAMLKLRDKALRGCRGLLIQQSKSQMDVTFMLASCVLLLLYEKLAGEGQQNWTPHLHFFARSLREHPDLNAWKEDITTYGGTSRSDTLRFLTALFYYNDLVHATSLEAPTLSDFYLAGDYAPKLDSDRSISLERFTFPSLITRISAGDLAVTDADIAAWHGRLDWMPSLALTRAPGTSHYEGLEDCEDGQTISELYRIAAMVYRRQRLRQAPMATAQLDGLESFDIACTGYLALRATDLLQQLREGSVYETSLLWPIGIIAKELSDENNIARENITSKLQSLEKRFHMRHFGLVRRHLYEYWQAKDQGQPKRSNACILFG